MANLAPNQRDAIRNIRTFPQLIKFLRDELEWPIESEDFEALTFDYTPEELGIDTANAAKIQEIKRLRPLSAGQPWGIFFVKFEPKRLPVVALRRVLSRVVLKKRASANSADRAAWQADDLLFVSNYGEGEERQISFAHFSQHAGKADLPTLKVLGWDNRDTPLHLDDIADALHQRLAWPDDDRDAKGWREQWRSAFTLRHLEVVTTSKDLAVRLADLARAIRDRIQTVLAIETESGPLTKLMKAFQQALIHDLSADDFADMYAQTIAYGLLSARVANPTHDTADAVSTHIPVTNPFLKEMMETFLHLGGRKRKDRGGDGIDFDELGVSEVVELLDAANMEAVVRDFGDRNRDEDPVIHFYELFLKEYDAKKRIQRGVFYTPQPVVSYIVRSAHELLKTEFGLEDGLASTVTWGEMAAKNSGLKIPDGVNATDPFVVILDPATGTATFLVEVIDVIHRTLAAKWKQQRLTDAQQQVKWNEYVPTHLLRRLHGYELMMAPYAIAHMKIGLKLYETGYSFDSDERARIYLTNTLEPASDDKDQREFEELAPVLAHEAKAVNAIKRDQHFTVIVGNPPYSVNSANKNSPIDVTLAAYKEALDDERNLKPINDDYVKFLRWSQLILHRTGAGLLGMITNHSYASARLFRSMRHCLLREFRSVNFLDLRGETSRDPSMVDDRNVFAIQQGVGIGVFVLGGATRESSGNANIHELIGSQETKYSWLATHSVVSTPWKIVHPRPELYSFGTVSEDIDDEYRTFAPLNKLFMTGNVGYQTHRDEFVIDPDRDALIARMNSFREHRCYEQELSKLFEVRSNRDWSVVAAHRAVQQELPISKLVQQTLYRPFDIRHICYASCLIDYDRRDLMRHMHDQNVGLLVSKVFDEHEFTSAFVTKWIVESKVADRTRGAYLFPLRLADLPGELLSRGKKSGEWRTNIAHEYLAQISERLGVDIDVRAPNDRVQGISDMDILQYSYAILYSPGYRRRYAEFLKTDFPRLPFTSSLELFRALAKLGGELVALHLLESPRLDRPITTYTGPAHAQIEKVSRAPDTVWLDKAQTRGFRGVPDDVWDFHIGGYQVCEKWLKDRKGRALSKDEIVHYQKIVVALSETIRLMKEIDEVIENHGGWPGAFAEKALEHAEVNSQAET